MGIKAKYSIYRIYDGIDTRMEECQVGMKGR